MQGSVTSILFVPKERLLLTTLTNSITLGILENITYKFLIIRFVHKMQFLLFFLNVYGLCI